MPKNITKAILAKRLHQQERKSRRLKEEKEVLLLHLGTQRRMAKLLGQLQHYLDDTRTVSKVIVETATAFLDCESGSLTLFDESKQQLVITASVGLRPEEETIVFSPGEGFAGTAWQTGKAKWVANSAELDPAFSKKPQQRIKLNGLASVPVAAGGTQVGVLNCHNKRDDGDISEEDVDNLSLLASYVGSVLQLAPLREKQKELAWKDAMTGLFRRDRLPDVVEEQLKHHVDQYLHFFLLDMDNFKQVNDRHGHQKGDAAIRAIASKLQELFGQRADSYLCHWGGDEFVLVVFSHEISVAHEIRERLNAALMGLSCTDLPDVRFSVSIGVATERVVPGLEYDALVRDADAALYTEKGGKSHSWRRVLRRDDLGVTVIVEREDRSMALEVPAATEALREMLAQVAPEALMGGLVDSARVGGLPSLADSKGGA